MSVYSRIPLGRLSNRLHSRLSVALPTSFCSSPHLRSYSSPSKPSPAVVSKDTILDSSPHPPPSFSSAPTGSEPPNPNPTPPPYFILDSPADGIHQQHINCHWLRDADQGPLSVVPGTKHKRFSTATVPADIGVSGVELAGSTTEGRVLKVKWNDRVGAGKVKGETEETEYPVEFLKSYATKQGWDSRHREDALKPILWFSSSQLAASPSLYIPYSEWCTSKEARYRALRQLVQYGIVFFTDVPTEHKEGVQVAVKELVEIGMGECKKTWYGEYWDVKSLGSQAKNVAFTGLELRLHMDLLHFQNPPRFQILHSLINRVKGGLSAFLDAYAVLPALSDSSLATLATHPIAFEYINDGHHTHWEHPTVELKPGYTPAHLLQGGHWRDGVQAINYSPPFQAPLLTCPLGPSDLPPYTGQEQAALVSALKEFEALIEVPERRFERRLEEGLCVVFDNRRVLHARTAFEDDSDSGVGGENEGGTKRWFKGAYVEGDSVWEKLRVLDAEFGER